MSKRVTVMTQTAAHIQVIAALSACIIKYMKPLGVKCIQCATRGISLGIMILCDIIDETFCKVKTLPPTKIFVQEKVTYELARVGGTVMQSRVVTMEWRIRQNGSLRPVFQTRRTSWLPDA